MIASALLTLALAAAPALTPSSKADPVEVARLKAQAAEIIQASEAKAQFADDTRWDFPAVRHRESGLRCLFQPGERDGDEIVRIGQEGVAAGVGCFSRPSGFSQRLEAVRLTSSDTLDTVFTGSVESIAGAQSGARAYEGPRMEIRVEPLPGGPKPAEIRSARYLVQKDGQEMFSLVSVALIDGWYVRQYFEAPAARAEEADMLASVVMTTTLIDLAARKA